MRTIPIAAAGLLLAGCVAEPLPPAPPPAEDPDACGASALQHLVGQPDEILMTMTFPDSTRFIGPDTVITMDFNPRRLNIKYDRRGIITDVTCG